MNTEELITVNTKNGDQKLKKAEYARWLCLIEAMDLVERKSQDLKLDMNGDDFWVKPLAFQKYIDQRLETMVLDVEREEFNRSLDSGIIPTYKDETQPVVEEEPEPAELLEVAKDQ